MPNKTKSVRLVMLRPRTEVVLSELILIEAAVNYSILHFQDGTNLKIALSIQSMALRVPELVRIHKRYLVNLAYVQFVYRHQASIRLITGKVLPVARRRKTQVRHLVNQHRLQWPVNSLLVMNPDQPQPDQAEPLVKMIAPVGAQQLKVVPNRAQRNENYTELGSLKLPDGLVRVYAYKKDGSMLLVMPDQSGFLIDTSIAATQCYKYWKLEKEAAPAEEATINDKPQTSNETHE